MDPRYSLPLTSLPLPIPRGPTHFKHPGSILLCICKPLLITAHFYFFVQIIILLPGERLVLKMCIFLVFQTPLTLAEMTMAMGIDLDSPGMKEIFESPAQKPPPLNRKKSSRRTTMMQPELRQSLRKSCLTQNMKPREEPPTIEGGTAGNRRRSSRIAASSQPATGICRYFHTINFGNL